MEGLNCCQICYASELNPKTIKELRCKHTLCRTCFLRLVKKECPFCRAPFGTKKEIICGESILTQYYIENIDSPQSYYNPPIEDIYIDNNISNSLPNMWSLDSIYNTRVGRRMKRREKLMAKNGRKKDIAPDKEIKPRRRHVRREMPGEIFEMEDIY
jgi:hypothetical protein